MKQLIKVLAAILLVFLMVMPAFSEGGKESASGKAVPIELWYGAAVTEAGPPPSDWVAYKIIREKLGIELKMTALPSSENDQDVKINAAGAANTLPDIFMVRRPVWATLVKQNLIADVGDMFDKMPNRTKIQYDADSKAHTTVNGKVYGLASPGSIAKNEGLLIRKDWLDNLGLKVPTTLDEMFEVMKAFTFNDPDKNGKDDTWGFGAFLEINSLEGGLGRRLEPIMGAFGVAGTWNMTAANPGLNVRKPAYYDAMVFMKKMIDAKVIDPNWMAYKKDDFRAAWKQGKFGIFREQNAAYASESNYAPFDKNFPNGEFLIINGPKGPNGDFSMGPFNMNYRIYAVSARAAKAGKKDAIARLLEWMSSDEGYMLLGYGEKGVNYNLDPNGVPTPVGLADPSKAWTKPEMQPYTQLRNMVYYNGDIELTSRYPTYTTAVSKREMSALKALRSMQALQWTPSIGADTLPVPNADLKRFWEQGVLEFLTGKRTLTKDNWNTWLAEFDKIGAADWEKAGIAFARENNLLR